MSLPDAATMTLVTNIDVSAMPSLSQIFRNPTDPAVTNLRGSTPNRSDMEEITTAPVRCRLVPGTAQGQLAQARLFTDKIDERTVMTLQCCIDDLTAQAISIQPGDEFLVSTVLHMPSGPVTIVNRWKAKGEPETASFSTNMPVLVTGVD